MEYSDLVIALATGLFANNPTPNSLDVERLFNATDLIWDEYQRREDKKDGLELC